MKGKMVALRGETRTNVASRVISMQKGFIEENLEEWQRYCLGFPRPLPSAR
jgi:hypothetical protein